MRMYLLGFTLLLVASGWAMGFGIPEEPAEEHPLPAMAQAEDMTDVRNWVPAPDYEDEEQLVDDEGAPMKMMNLTCWSCGSHALKSGQKPMAMKKICHQKVCHNFFTAKPVCLKVTLEQNYNKTLKAGMSSYNCFFTAQKKPPANNCTVLASPMPNGKKINVKLCECTTKLCNSATSSTIAAGTLAAMAMLAAAAKML